MKREIKFRAWLKNSRELVDVEIIDFEERTVMFRTLKGIKFTCFEDIELLMMDGAESKKCKDYVLGLLEDSK